MMKLNQTIVRLLLLENFFPKSLNLFTKSNLNCNFVRVLQIFLNYYLNRISAGIHTGGVVAGIVGSKMPRYIVLYNVAGIVGSKIPRYIVLYNGAGLVGSEMPRYIVLYNVAGIVGSKILTCILGE